MTSKGGFFNKLIGGDLVQPTGDDQALHDPDVPGAEFGPTEHFSARRASGRTWPR